MPNWSYNTVCIKGKKDAMQKLINNGLENSGLEPTNDIEKDFDNLLNNATVKCVDNIDGKLEIDYKKGLTARTFMPMPDTFLLHDTTNYPNAYPTEVCQEQIEKYGALGWYDYNCLTLGTKWDFDLQDAELMETPDGKWQIIFYCETAWSTPDAWCINIKKLVPEINVGYKADEESGAYYQCCYVKDGAMEEYGDLTGKYDAMCKDFNDSREHCEKKIRDDKELMEKLEKEVRESNSEMTEDEVKEEIDRKVEWLVDEECGEWVETSELMDELEDIFTEMIEKVL